MCKEKHFTRNLHYNCEGHASIILTPCLDEIWDYEKHSGTWFHPIISTTHWPKYPANSENILKTGHKYVLWATLYYGPPFDLSWHSKIKTRQLFNLTFIRRNTRAFTFVTYATYAILKKKKLGFWSWRHLPAIY